MFVKIVYSMLTLVKSTGYLLTSNRWIQACNGRSLPLFDAKRRAKFPALENKVDRAAGSSPSLTDDMSVDLRGF